MTLEMDRNNTDSHDTFEDLKTGAEKSGDCRNPNNIQPIWYDHERFCRGQQFFQRHVATIAFSMHLSLVAGFSLANLLEPLVFTNKSNTPKKSVRRYLMTFYHIFLWMTHDVWDRNGKAYKSLQTVRGMHNQTANSMNAKNKSKIHVSQYDMALVQSGFFAAVLMYPKQFGIRCNENELADYVFTWRVIGYLLGIDDKYNICSRNSFKDTYKLCKELERKSVLPALLNPPKDYDHMAKAYIDGLNSASLCNMHSVKSTLALIYDGFGLNILCNMGIIDWLRFYFWKCYFLLAYHISAFEKLLNWAILRSFCKDIERVFGEHIQNEIKNYSNATNNERHSNSRFSGQ